jgi:hypothetical protein
VSREKDPHLAALIGAVTGEEPSLAEEEPALSGFGERLRDALERAVAHLREEGLVEVEEDLVPSLVAEVTEAGLDARSPKAMMKRVIRTLLKSEHVEEVYGTDEMLTASLRAFLDPS